MSLDATEPRYSVWETVASLEGRGFTREEIAIALDDVASSIHDEHFANQ